MAKKVIQSGGLFGDEEPKVVPVKEIELSPVVPKKGNVPDFPIDLTVSRAPEPKIRTSDIGPLPEELRKEMFPTGRSLTLRELKQLKNKK